MTLPQAQQQLEQSLAALARARNATAYGIADRNLQREKVEGLQAQVNIWSRKVRELQAATAGAKSPGAIYPKWR